MSDHDYYTAYAEEEDGEQDWDAERVVTEINAAVREQHCITDELWRQWREYEQDWHERSERIQKLEVTP